MKKKHRLGNAAIFREFNGVGQTPNRAERGQSHDSILRPDKTPAPVL